MDVVQLDGLEWCCLTAEGRREDPVYVDLPWRLGPAFIAGLQAAANGRDAGVIPYAKKEFVEAWRAGYSLGRGHHHVHLRRWAPGAVYVPGR